MTTLTVGKVTEEFKGLDEGLSVDVNENGISILFTYEEPTRREITDISKEIGMFKLVEVDGIVFLLLKFGKQNWADCAFRIQEHTSQSLLHDIKDGEGYGMFITLADPKDGVVHALRAIGVSSKFSRELNRMLSNKSVMDKYTWMQKVMSVQNRYTTEQLVDMAKVEYTSGTIE